MGAGAAAGDLRLVDVPGAESGGDRVGPAVRRGHGEDRRLRQRGRREDDRGGPAIARVGARLHEQLPYDQEIRDAQGRAALRRDRDRAADLGLARGAVGAEGDGRGGAATRRDTQVARADPGLAAHLQADGAGPGSGVVDGELLAAAHRVPRQVGEPVREGGRGGGDGGVRPVRGRGDVEPAGTGGRCPVFRQLLGAADEFGGDLRRGLTRVELAQQGRGARDVRSRH